MTVDEIERILAKLEQVDSRINQCSSDIALLKGTINSQANLIKWVITPLIIIVGALVGIKIF